MNKFKIKFKEDIKMEFYYKDYIKKDKLNYFLDEKTIYENHNKFIKSTPFNNIVIDNMFYDHIIDHISSLFPSPLEKKWWVYDNPLEKKLAFNKLSELDTTFSDFFEFMNSNFFINFLEKLTGLNGLIPDRNLNGGGLHQIVNGGKLDIHEDYNIHKDLKAFRKVNAILYLNKNWKESYGGHLEMWDKNMTKCEEKILPIANRLVVFRTDQTSNHGHPHPLTCPEDESRKSLAIYYYLRTDDVEKTPYKSTIFKKLPNVIEDPEIDELRKKRSLGRIENKTT